MAGLIELADEEFQFIRDKNLDIKEAVIEKKEIDDTKIYEEINLITIKRYILGDTEIIPKIIRVAEGLGFTTHFNDEDDENFSDVIFACSLLNIFDIQSLHNFLKGKFIHSKKIFATINNVNGVDNPVPWDASHALIILLFLLSYLDENSLTTKYDNSSWGEDIWASLVLAIQKLKNEFKIS